MGTITPKNAARLRIAKFAIPVIGALIFAVLYNLPMAPQQQALSPANSGFSVKLPCHAQSKTSQLDSGFGQQTQTDYFCAADGVHYVVGYTDIPAAVMAPLRQAHDTTPLLGPVHLTHGDRVAQPWDGMLGAGPKQGRHLARAGNDADRPRLHNPKGKLDKAATALLLSLCRSRPALRRAPRIGSLV